MKALQEQQTRAAGKERLEAASGWNESSYRALLKVMATNETVMKLILKAEKCRNVLRVVLTPEG